MKKLFIISTLQLLSIFSFGQQIILPGDKSINKALLKNSTTIFDYSNAQQEGFVKVGSYKVEVNYTNETLDVKTTLSFKNKNAPWRDHFISDGNNFKPISVQSLRSDRNLNLKFSSQITGIFQDHNRMKKTMINEKPVGSFFDISIYPYILQALPLAENYKAIIPVYDYEATTPNKRFSNVRITGVRATTHSSLLTGSHDVWKVDGFEESTNQTFQYEFDKNNRKIWSITIRTENGTMVLLENNEIDARIFKNKFDKDATLKMITQGKSSIKGQAFARDNKNGGALQGMAVLNLNKKQVAWKGTEIVLTPYTKYFKEWNKANQANHKKGLPSFPLPEGADECFIKTQVYDDEGHFEFKNLMPGDYLLTTSFIYEHSATSTSVIGQTDYFTNGIYQGSNAITSSKNFMADAKAKISKVVTIEKEGEIVTIKLKKTL